MRSPRSVPDASMSTMLATSVDTRVLVASQAGRIRSAAIRIGPKIVAMKNDLSRTRSMYSRLKTARILSMASHPLLDAGGTDLLQEDLVQRGLHLLETFDDGTTVQQPPEEHLRIGSR